MLTLNRLLSAYKNAKQIEFDEHSKYIFFSDVHRGDNSLSDEFAHNQNLFKHALQHYYNEGYTYVEVGDGDELWEQSKYKVIRYAHSDVFMLLRAFHNDQRFIMLYGNHNIVLKNKAYVQKNLYTFYDEYEETHSDLFKNIEIHEALILKNSNLSVELFAVHGHQGDFINDQIWPITRFMSRYFWRLFHIIGFQNPASPAKNAHKRHKIEVNYSKFITAYNKVLIVGHTHRPKFPRQDELPYFNTGCCIHPRNITGLEIVNNQITLIEWSILPDDKGSLRIVKKEIRGPRNLSEFSNM